MIAIDTNVLLRLLHDDGSPHVATARRRVTQAVDDGHSLFLAQTCLCGTVWVLMRHHGFPRDRLALAIAAMLANPAFVLEARSEVERALVLFGASHADFADCLIVSQRQRAGCAGTLTFDQAMIALPDVEVLA